MLRLAFWVVRALGWQAGRMMLVPITFYYLFVSKPLRVVSADYLGRVLGRRAAPRDVFRHVFTFANVMFSAHAQDNLLVATIMSRLARLPDREAAFVQQKHLSSLAAPLSSSGRLVFRHPAHLEQITVSPRPETLVIDGGVLEISEGGAPARRVALDSHPALQALAQTITDTLGGDLAALQRIYVVTATGTDAAWHVTLLPKDASVMRFLTSVTLEGAGNALQGLDITQTNGDRQMMAIRPVS